MSTAIAVNGVADTCTAGSNSSTRRQDDVLTMDSEQVLTTTTDNSWVASFNRWDRVLSGSLLHLSYRLVDVVLLLIGLNSRSSACLLSDRLAMTSICLLIFYLIDLGIISHFFIRHITGRYRDFTEDQYAEQLRRVTGLRGFFMFFKMIPVGFGLSYAFTSTVPASDACEVIRFCLGLVCFSTLLIVIMPPAKPELPSRRSLMIECLIFAFILLINGLYIGTVASAMNDVEASTCVSANSEDLYLRAPLKTFARAGLILFGSITSIHLVNIFITQICHRLIQVRRWHLFCYAFQYLLSSLIGIGVIYYFSVGALLLFQPRSGQPCRTDAPALYRTLLIWQWLRMLAPLIALPLVLVLCCLGVFVGIILSYCLPASITVPLLELLRGWVSNSPAQINPNPPATEESIAAIPVVLYGQEADKFNQTECAICQVNFEANEPIKKLECGHLFHSGCVANWLSITRICPICRHRMSTANP